MTCMCGAEMVHVGTTFIMDNHEVWEAEAERYRCGNGHIAFIVPAAPVEQAEGTEVDRDALATPQQLADWQRVREETNNG